MKYKCTICDLCGNDITSSDRKYKVIKVKRYTNNYCNFDEFEFSKWDKIDVCDCCMKKIIDAINEKDTKLKIIDWSKKE